MIIWFLQGKQGNWLWSVWWIYKIQYWTLCVCLCSLIFNLQYKHLLNWSHAFWNNHLLYSQFTQFLSYKIFHSCRKFCLISKLKTLVKIKLQNRKQNKNILTILITMKNDVYTLKMTKGLVKHSQNNKKKRKL